MPSYWPFSIFFHETEADSAYDKGPARYFGAYRLTNKGGTSYEHIYIFVRKAPSLNQKKILSGT